MTSPQSAILPTAASKQFAGLGRLASLDAFRGLTMILMVLVNSAGSDAVYTQLEHTTWHGLTLADVIFPSFVWIVGITTTMSLGSRLAKATKPDLVKQVVWRAAKMYVLGLCLYTAPAFSLSTQRLLGVLQRIAICYLVGGLLYLFTTRRTQVVCIIALLAGYWAVMTLVPAPGFQRGDLSMEGNLAHYVDRIVLGTHNYVNTKTWDPEGVLSTLPAIATMLLGMMAGYELQRKTDLKERLKRIAIAGLVLLAAGLVVNHWFPINKKLWSTSFVLVIAGIDCLTLPLFTYWVDIKGRQRSLKPPIVMGMNAITVYLLSELLDQFLSLVRLHGTDQISLKEWLFQTCFQPLASPPMASFLYAAAYTLLMYGFAYVLYRKHIFLPPLSATDTQVQRSDYLIFDRGRLGYLNAVEKVACIYCSYANGLLAYIAEIAARTEQHFCPIKHARRVLQSQSRYAHLLSYGDARAYREQSEAAGNDFSDLVKITTK